MPTFEEFARAEFRTASSELSRSSPQEAIIRFYHRQDAAINAAVASATTKPACRAGCSYCCNYKVVARAAEVIALQQFVVSRFKPEQIQTAVAQAQKNVAEVKGLSHQEHLAVNQRCPFLVDEKCAVYPVRPSKCRAFHASDVDGCRLSYENPTDLSIPNSYVAEVFDAATGTAEGFYAAQEAEGYDSRVYDLNSAFLEAMQNPASVKRLRSAKKVFLHAKTETPLGE